MTDINLLPWREEKREVEQKQFTSMLVLGIVIAVGIVVIMKFYMNNQIESQTARNQKLTKEIQFLDRQIKEIKQLKAIRLSLISRMNIIQNLQATRPLTIHLFDEMIRLLPKGVFITKMERTGNQILIIGHSESNSDISNFMRKIEANAWVHNPVLSEIKKVKKVKGKEKINDEFKLSFILKPFSEIGLFP
jgi:type IV pilus assembly protein PilN